MSSIPRQTRQWILTNKPTDTPSLTGPSPTFTLETNHLPDLKDDQILVRSVYFSNDPAQRGWINRDVDPARLYTTPVPQGAVMRAGAIAEVVDSKSSKFKKGNTVRASMGWAEYAVQDASACQPVQHIPGVSDTHYLGALGHTGLTAWYGLEVARAGKDDAVVVSGAAGATGSMVVQIAKKILGCRKVIGMAGSEEKCKWVESLGADVCVDYKKPDFK